MSSPKKQKTQNFHNFLKSYFVFTISSQKNHKISTNGAKNYTTTRQVSQEKLSIFTKSPQFFHETSTNGAKLYHIFTLSVKRKFQSPQNLHNSPKFTKSPQKKHKKSTISPHPGSHRQNPPIRRTPTEPAHTARMARTGLYGACQWNQPIRRMPAEPARPSAICAPSACILAITAFRTPRPSPACLFAICTAFSCILAIIAFCAP